MPIEDSGTAKGCMRLKKYSGKTTAIAMTTFAAAVGFMGTNLWTPVKFTGSKLLTPDITIESDQNDQQLAILLKQSVWIYSVAISPDGQTLASGSYDKTIKVWNLRTGKLLHILLGHREAVQAVAFSRDGKLLASGSWDKTIKLWNLETGELIRTFSGHLDDIKAIAISSDGQTLASGSWDKTIKLWNLETGKLLRTLNQKDVVRSVAFSPDGQILASGSEDGKIMTWQLSTGELRTPLAAHDKAVWSIAFSPDGQTLASGSCDRTIKLWHPQTGQLLRTLTGHDRAVWSVAFSPDGQTLASGSYDRTIKLWHPQTGQLLRTLAGHNQGVWSVAFSPDEQTLASAGADETIRLWRVSPDRPASKPSPTLQKPTISELGAALTTAPEITNSTQLYALNRNLYNQINQEWQNRSASEQDSVYRVGVGEDGEILGYSAVNPAADNSSELTPLSDLLYKLVTRPATKQEPMGHFKVVFTNRGVLEVSPWRGYTGTPQLEAEITDEDRLKDLNQKLYDKIQQNREVRRFPERLLYRVAINKDGAIADYEALNQPAFDYIQETPLKSLLKSSNTPTSTASQKPLAYFKVVFTPTGVLEVSPWQGWGN